MPVRPLPFKLTCPACGTSRVVQYRSDGITLKAPTECPHCRTPDLQRTPATALDVRWARLTGRYLEL